MWGQGPERHAGRPRDLWTFTGIDADSKLAVSWLVGARTVENAVDFMQDVAARLAHRVQLSTDGHGMYLTAVRAAFGFARVDYAQLVRPHQTLTKAAGGKTTPGMAAGLADRPWTFEDVLARMGPQVSVTLKPGQYPKGAVVGQFDCDCCPRNFLKGQGPPTPQSGGRPLWLIAPPFPTRRGP